MFLFIIRLFVLLNDYKNKNKNISNLIDIKNFILSYDTICLNYFYKY